MKYYHTEIKKEYKDEFKKLLNKLNVYFEISAAGWIYHFEILLKPNSKEYKKINKFLEVM